MLSMLCSFPSPCGNEETYKRYLKTLIKTESYEDSIGNLIVKKDGGNKKVMVYCSIDEDAFVVIDNTDGKVNFAHLGNKKVYPGDVVSFDGYKGVICAEDYEKPDKNQYIRMIGDVEIKQGQVGVFEEDYYEEEDKFFAKEAAKRIAIASVLQTLEEKSDNSLYFVFGVQDNNADKGIKIATKTIAPDMVISFEQTDCDNLTLKVVTKGFSVNNRLKELFDDIEFEVSDEKSSASSFLCAETAVIGIPVSFAKDKRQMTDIKYVEQLKKTIIKFIK